MAADVYTYSPSEVRLTFGGYNVEGWVNIGITRNTEFVKQIRGIRGKHAKEVSRDTSSTILLTLLQTSETNTVFSQILEIEQGTNGLVRMEVTLADKAGGSVFQSNEVYIGGYPTVSYSSEIAEVQWKLLCDTSTWTIKGNAQNSSGLMDMLTGAAGKVGGFIGDAAGKIGGML